MTVTTFVVVSYTELQNKIGQQTARGEDLYELKGGRASGAASARPLPQKQQGKAARRRKG
jgi:hypothetical protein